jgi:hypothetical protein
LSGGSKRATKSHEQEREDEGGGPRGEEWLPQEERERERREEEQREHEREGRRASRNRKELRLTAQSSK